MTLRLVATLVLLAGCKQSPSLNGQVVDIWGNPVPDATIVLEGHPGRPTSDAYGNFSLPLVPGKQKLKAGREGYIQEHLDIEVLDGQPPPHPILQLYPKPEEPGFYVIGGAEYVRLDPERIYAYGSEIGAVTGIRSVQQRVDSDPLRIVFATELRMDQIMRLGLELDALEYKRTATMTDVLGTQEVKLNMWVSKGEIPLDITPMRSRNAYLITPKSEVGPGWYAFSTQDLLHALDTEMITTVPENLRVAFPFELR